MRNLFPGKDKSSQHIVDRRKISIMEKKFCILTSAHPIDDVRVYRKIALSVIKEFKVIWIGPDISFFENELGNDGIERYLFRNKKGIIGRLHNNLKALIIFIKHRKNVDYVYFPDPDIALSYICIIKSKKIKKIFDIHEVFHKYLLSRNVRKILLPIFEKIVENTIKKVVRNVDLTIGVSGTVLNYYTTLKTPSMIIRSCLPKKYLDIKSYEVKKNDLFTFVHGKNAASRGTFYVLDALRILKGRGISCKVLMITLRNSGSNEKFNSYINKYSLNSYIDLYDGLPFEEMINKMAQCHAGLIAYGRDLGVDSLPNRIFEYMALSLPVIVPNFALEIVSIIEKEKCGLIVDPEDSSQLADHLEYLIKHPIVAQEMGNRGNIAFLNKHNWEVEFDPFIKYLKSEKC